MDRARNADGIAMAIDGDEWRDLLDRFATKTDLEQFQGNVERILAVINAKLDQFVVKEMQAMLIQQESEWKKDASQKMHEMREEIDAIKRNRLPPWIPNLTHVIGWALLLITVYFRPH